MTHKSVIKVRSVLLFVRKIPDEKVLFLFLEPSETGRDSEKNH